MGQKTASFQFCDVKIQSAQCGSEIPIESNVFEKDSNHYIQKKLLLISSSTETNFNKSLSHDDNTFCPEVAYDGGFGIAYSCRVYIQDKKSIYHPSSAGFIIYQVKSFIDILSSDSSFDEIKILNKSVVQTDKYYIKTNENKYEIKDVTLTEAYVYEKENNIARLRKLLTWTIQGRNVAIDISRAATKTAGSSPRCVGNLCLDVDTLFRHKNGCYFIDSRQSRFNFYICDVYFDATMTYKFTNINGTYGPGNVYPHNCQQNTRLFIELLFQETENVMEMISSSIQYVNQEESTDVLEDIYKWCHGRNVLRVI